MPKNAQTTAQLHSHTSKIILKILQARLQQSMNHELPDVQAGFRNGRGTRDQIANICWIIKKSREFQKNIYFCFIDYAKAFGCVDHNELENSERDENTRPSDLFLRNLYAGQEATVRTGHGNMSMPGHAGRCRSVSKLELDMEICPCGEKYQEPQICR